MQQEITSVFYNLFQKIEAEGICPNSLYQANIALIPKQGKNITRNVKYKCFMNIDQNIPNKVLACSI